MKKYSLILILLICYAQANTFDKEISLIKDYSLAYCLYNFNQTAPSNDIAVAQDMYFQAMTIGLKEYKKYTITLKTICLATTFMI